MNGHEKNFTWYDMLDAAAWGRHDAIGHVLRKEEMGDANEFIEKLLKEKNEKELTANK